MSKDSESKSLLAIYQDAYDRAYAASHKHDNGTPVSYHAAESSARVAGMLAIYHAGFDLPRRLHAPSLMLLALGSYPYGYITGDWKTAFLGMAFISAVFAFEYLTRNKP